MGFGWSWNTYVSSSVVTSSTEEATDAEKRVSMCLVMQCMESSVSLA